MSEKAKKSIKSRMVDLLMISLGLGILALSYYVFKGKLKNFSFLNSYFYILAIIGIIGFLGEKLFIILSSIFLPISVMTAAVAFKTKPDKFSMEEWGDAYISLGFATGCFLIYLFFRYEKLRSSGMESKPSESLHTRVDPRSALKYKEKLEKAEKSKNISIPLPKQEETKEEHKEEKKSEGGLLSSLKKAVTKSEPAKEQVQPSEPVESIEERAERELTQMKEELNRRSTKLTTTLIRIKGLAKSLDRDQIFDNVVKTISKGLDAPKVQLLLNDETNEQFHIVQAVGMDAVEYKQINVPYTEDCMITHLRTLKVSEVTGGSGALGIKECEIDPQTKGLIGQGTVKSILCAPIYTNDKLFAVLNIEEMKNSDYTRDDQNLLTTCAEIAGLVMKNAHLYSATMNDLISAKQLSENQLKANEQLKSSLQRIVSPSVAEMIMSDPDALKLGGNKCEVSTFFSDIRGFTKMSENMDPTDIVDQLNVYFTRMTDILMELNGTLDKYVGDELMALFGAPVARPDDPIRAVLCGVRMLDALYELHKVWEKEGKPIIKIGVGVNTGIVTAGYMGSEKALSYTVIGDNVNLAARIMAQAKGMEMYITKSTYDRVKDYFDIEQRDAIMVKGKSMPIDIYCVLRAKPEVNFEELLNLSQPTIPESTSSNSPNNKVEDTAEEEPVYIPPGLSEAERKQNIKLDKVKPIICQKCGTENDPQEKFCCKCGMPIF